MQPFSYLMTTNGMIWIIACLPIGFLLIALGYFVFNEVPAKWFCDYDEQPNEALLTQRVRYKGSGIILSLAAAICLMICRLQFNKGFDIYFCILSLIIIIGFLIIVSDCKYTIIPDQFTGFLAVMALAVSAYDLIRGYNILHSAWWTPLAGAAIGAGIMLLIDFLGMIIYKKTGMGFGDVKLFAAVGILTGFPGTIYTIIMAVLIAAVCFVIIIAAASIKSKKSEEIQNAEKETAAENKDEEDSTAEKNNTSEEEQQEGGKGSYLAFGPYIMIATIIYIVFFDSIHSMVEMYFKMLS